MYMPEALLFNEPVTLSLKQISASNYSTPLGAKTAATASGTETGQVLECFARSSLSIVKRRVRYSDASNTV